MEWTARQYLEVQGAQSDGARPQCGAFHHSQALFAAAVGQHITEFDALTGCKLSSINIGASVVRMAYSPAGGHVIVAVLEDWSIKSWDLDTEHTHFLYSPAKKTDRISEGMEIHIALTPLRPWLFFGTYRRSSVNVVGTIEGAKPATIIKTDLKKPVTGLACHPRSPLLFVAYAEGLIRAYHIQSFTVQYTLQIDTSIKLVGAGAFAFHPTLEWVFVGDRSGTLIAWDVSVPTQPSMIGITQAGSNPISALSWHSMLRLLVTLSRDGMVQVWRTRVILNSNKPPMRANFFESAGVESLDVAKVLAQCSGDTIYPVPKITDFLLHPKLNLATILFPSNSRKEEARRRASAVSREARKQLFSVLQSARGSPGSVLKEKLALLGSTGILPDYQLQMQLQQARGQQGLTMSDLARKAFLYGKHGGEPRDTTSFRLPLLSIADPSHHLRDLPVCQPLQQDLGFFTSEQGIFNYPVRAFFMDGCNLSAYNLASGDYNIYKKLSPTALGGQERSPTHMLYSSRQHLFLIFFECRGAIGEIVIYRESLTAEAVGERLNTITGRDGAFLGFKEDKYAILDEDGVGLTLYPLEDEVKSATSNGDTNGALDASTFSELHAKAQTYENGQKGLIQFVFDSPVQRIYSTPLDSLLMYVSSGSHIGLTRIFSSGYGASGDMFELSTKQEDGRFLKIRQFETVLQVRWQETMVGQFAGILTTERVMIVSQNLEVINSTSATFDKGFPPFRSLVWVGPALLFSTPTTVAVLGWDGPACAVTTLAAPNSVLVGTLNDRLLLVCHNDPSPRQKQLVEIKTRLAGLLEPLLIGWTTLQVKLQPKLDLSEILFRLTSRFDSLRVTPRSLDALARVPSVCGELAVELSQAGPQFTQELRCKYAVVARRFQTALSILKDEFLRSRDYPRCPRTSRLFHRFQELGRECIKFGQFDQAKEVYEAVSDYESMLDLFICHLNPSALRRLVQKLEETGVEPELKRLSEKILIVRSSGWGQGGVFANFAAESLAPKGPEWAGGNWQIKTFPEVKSSREWELSGEVTAYMKTPSGPIPTLIPDHIGVYFGTLKGRGSVVEVRDDALVRRLTNGEADIEKPAPALALPSTESKAAEDSLLNKIRAAKKDDGIVDEQAKAAEEFKKGLYGVDGSSSEEDETSTTKKKIRIKIRDKPATTTVDVDKVKEATKQFKLADTLPPRTRRASGGSQGSFGSSGGIQDIPIQTTTTQTNTEVFPVIMGMGVSAASGPIPEDFFHANGTGQGSGAAQPLTVNITPDGLTPGLWTSNVPQVQNMAGAPAGIVGGPGIMSNGVPPQADISLPDGGIPPQSGDLSLPDGGVPPQAAPQTEKTSTAPVNVNFESSMPAAALGVKAPSPPRQWKPGQVPRGASASTCFKAAVAHLEQNQLSDAMSCLDESFLALAKDRSLGVDVKAQAKICSQYKVAVLLLQEIAKLLKVDGTAAVGAKDEIARLARHLSTLPLQAKHRITCIRTAIKRNMDVQNYAFAKSQLDLLLSKAPPNKQEELRSLIAVCTQRGLFDRTIEDTEDPAQFCSATLGRLPTIGHDSCDLCSAKFSALTSPGCTICGMGTIRRSDGVGAPVSSPFS
ncbi:uncharacterized protein LOC9639327 [Selaginella moellendorffii]|uniref:uncharacterized protein LOC9639327 n=1 Tax=Selaginella moellendorffii TaxID=88036 RepID=UPI000D1CCC32|nr:uncharacterized protein LOC9639327 [Selaginella moellendorffii]|eukprot:XP_024518338.1 uncharacterized protein LOC9639327 [Selaginella moellendorffii]